MKVFNIKKGGESTRCHWVEQEDIKIVKEVMVALGMEKLFEQIIEDRIWQISLGSSGGRVFGYFVSDTFYILFFDPHHLIYADMKRGARYDMLHRNYNPWENIL